MSLEWALSWHDEALCSPVDAALFTSDVKPSAAQLTRLGQVCAACPVARQCANYALKTGASGVWAGVFVYPKGTARMESRRALERKVYA